MYIKTILVINSTLLQSSKPIRNLLTGDPRWSTC